MHIAERSRQRAELAFEGEPPKQRDAKRTHHMSVVRGKRHSQ